MIDVKRLEQNISKLSARRVFLQAPEGLKTQIQDICRKLEENGIEVFASVEPCYGACDIRDHEAKMLGCDLLVHIGHTDFGLKTELPTIYEEYRIDAEILPVLKENLKLLNGKKIGIAATLQYISSLNAARDFLRSRGKTVFLGKPVTAEYPGQVLGCDYSSPKSIESRVDSFLFIGSGRFHALEFTMRTQKPVFFLDVEKRTLNEISGERERLQRIRFAQFEKAKECRRFVVFVSTKPGQMFPGKALKAKQQLEKNGKEACIIAASELSPEKLLGMKIDCIVNCACPRLRDDFRQFKMPIINSEDVEKL